MDFHVLLMVGTRPDIIKLAPVHAALSAWKGVQVTTFASGQHTELAREALAVFSWEPTVTYHPEERTRLSTLYAALTGECGYYFRQHQPHFVVVHGDVVTALAAAQAAFFERIPVGHVEAGLRSSRFEEPFPEEGIRRTIAQLATLHFAPTPLAKENLEKENISPTRILVTGNTIVDALRVVLARAPTDPLFFTLNAWRRSRPLVLITCHRRESWGEPLTRLAIAVRDWSTCFPEVCFLWPLHVNPQVRQPVYAVFHDAPPENCRLSAPLSYAVFAQLLAQADLVLTDSGGVLEEAAVLGVPTLVLRNVTERPEALSLEHAQLIGYNFFVVEQYIARILQQRDTSPRSPSWNAVYGEGDAGVRIAKSVVSFCAQRA